MARRYPENIFSLALLAFVFSGVPQLHADQASDAAAEVTKALDALFVKTGRSGPMLREALQPDKLRALLAEGPAVDKRKGEKLLKLYSREIPGLKKTKYFIPRIAAVGTAIEAWLESLQRLDLEQDRGQMRIAIGRNGDTDTSELIASLRERLPECEFSYVNLESTL